MKKYRPHKIFWHMRCFVGLCFFVMPFLFGAAFQQAMAASSVNTSSATVTSGNDKAGSEAINSSENPPTSTQNVTIKVRKSSYEPFQFMGYAASFVPRRQPLGESLSHMKEQWQQLKMEYSAAWYDGNTTAMTPKNAHKWKFLLKKLRTAEKLDVLRGINNFMNRIPAKEDKTSYGKEEYWARPAEFFSKWGGDCEDYAFAKYFALQYLQWPVSELWVLFVYRPSDNLAHALLAVRHKGKIYYLDNLAKPKHKLLDDAYYKDKFLPLFAFSTEGLWVFKESFAKYRTSQAAFEKKAQETADKAAPQASSKGNNTVPANSPPSKP